MADISIIQTPDGNIYNVKDSIARSEKASKPYRSTDGNFPELDAIGNLRDSGHRHSDYVMKTQIGVANGIASLDSSGKVLESQLPAIASGDVSSVTMNGTTYTPTDGDVNLGTVITQHQDISGKLDSSLKGVASGLAELDENGKVPTSQLPSYVDDVQEYDSSSLFPATGESGKIYVAKDTNLTYRWGGSEYVEISPSLALGETSSTAYRGDRGASAYAHAVTNKGSAFSSGLYKIATNSEGHVTAATAVTKSDITDLGVPGEQPDVSGKADKSDTVLDTTLSRGRKSDTVSGDGSFAFGNDTAAIGDYSHAEGIGTYADTNAMHAGGTYNVRASNYPAFTVGATYNVGDRVIYNNNSYECQTTHTATSWIDLNWLPANSNGDVAVAIGNGTSDNLRSNAFTMTWDGTARLAGDLYVHANSNGTGGSPVLTSADFDEIKESIAIVEDGDTAEHAIHNGDFVLWKGELTKAVVDISIGGSLEYNLMPIDGGLGSEVKNAIADGVTNKLSSATMLSNAGADAQETPGRVYPVRLDVNGKMAVNVPWSDTTYTSKAASSGGTDVSLVTTGEKYTWNNKTSNTGTVTQVSTGAGLTGGPVTTTGTIKANLTSETNLTNAAADGTETSGRVYPVRLDKNGKLAVNVPWSNTNTTYSFSGGTNKFTYTPSGGSATDVNITVNDSTKLPLTGGTLTGHIYIKRSSVERGVAPSSDTYAALVMRDKNDKNIGSFQVGMISNGRDMASVQVLTNTSTSSADEYGGFHVYKTVGVSGNKSMYFNANTGECTADKFIGQISWDNVIEKPTSYTDTTKLPLTGGTLTQVASGGGAVILHFDKRNLTTQPSAGALENVIRVSYKNSQKNTEYYTYPISIIGTDATDGVNAGISLGSKNGVTFLSSGESANVMPSILSAYNSESVYITADGAVNVYTACANDGSSYVGPWTFGTNGVLTSPNGFSGLTNAQAIAALGATPVYTTTNQSVNGNKSFIGNLVVKTGTRHPSMYFQAANHSSSSGMIIAVNTADETDNTKYTPMQFSFREYSPLANKSGLTDYFEDFRLPFVDTGRTDNAVHTIYTTKNLTGSEVVSILGATPVYTTTDQEVDGVKTFLKQPVIKNGADSASIAFRSNRHTSTNAVLIADELAPVSDYSKYGNAQFVFRVLSPKSDGSGTAGYENYRLPAVTSNLGSGTIKNYDIFTTKNAGYMAGTYSGDNNTTLNIMGAYGFVSSGATMAFIMLPMNIPNSINSMTITTLKLSLRIASGGYLGGSENFDVSASTYTKTIYLHPENGIVEIRVTKSGGWGVTNNIPFSGNVGIIFTLSE